jgi:membrane-bound lytic murein transglycosylase D
MSAEQKQGLVRRKQSVAQADESGQEGTARYIVKQGDTLEKIAKNYGVSVRQLKTWNKLRSSTIGVGQELSIHTEAAQVTLAPKKNQSKVRPAGSVSAIVYVVKKGDSLWDIARIHNVTETQLRNWNNISGKKIRIGQELLIYKDRIASRS